VPISACERFFLTNADELGEQLVNWTASDCLGGADSFFAARHHSMMMYAGNVQNGKQHKQADGVKSNNTRPARSAGREYRLAHRC
jgi:hypothetical protein